MIERIIVLVTAFILDVIIGDPHWLWHPVQGIGRLIEYTEQLLRRVFALREERDADRGKKKVAGGILVILVLLPSVLVPMLILYAAERIHPYVRLAAEIVLCYQMLAMKSLRVESMKVYHALMKQDIEGARQAVSMIVGRDTEKLSEEGITKAAVETVAENTSDGVIAPLIYMALFGACGAFFYKAVNTMDSMIGYKNDKYIYLGMIAAKLDDVVNYIPARLSALFMIVVSGVLGMNAKQAWRIYKRDRYQHASPNSAQTEAVCAGALSIQLAGDAYYFGELYHKPVIGDADRPVLPEDIRSANRLMYGTSILTLLVAVIVLAVMCLYL